MRRMGSVLTLAVAALGMHLVMALPSHADTNVSVSGDRLSIRANAGVSNNIEIRGDQGTITVIDTADRLSGGGRCVKVNANEVRCSGIIRSIQVEAGDGDDTIANQSSVQARVNGGPGEDTMTAGSAGDRFTGGADDDTFIGGDGNDFMTADRSADGNDTFDGNGGVDTADYSNRADAVNVSLDGVANDGSAGEQDDMRSGVENINGGRAGDTLTGNEKANEIRGLQGDDTLNGRGGVDRLIGGTGTDTCREGENVSSCEG